MWPSALPSKIFSARRRHCREAARARQLDGKVSDGGGAARTADRSLDVGDGHLDLDARLNGDRRDLLHDLRGRVKVDEALVDAHLEAIPRVGTLTARRLAARDLENLGGEADRPLDLEALVLGALDQIAADCARTGAAQQRQLSSAVTEAAAAQQPQLDGSASVRLGTACGASVQPHSDGASARKAAPDETLRCRRLRDTRDAPRRVCQGRQRTLLQVFDVTAGERDANAVDLGRALLLDLLRLGSSSFGLRRGSRVRHGSALVPDLGLPATGGAAVGPAWFSPLAVPQREWQT